jgi:hypothetical protein
MANCSHTGLAIPECSCSACIRAQLERFHTPPAPAAPLLAGTGRSSVIRRIAARARRSRHREAV